MMTKKTLNKLMAMSVAPTMKRLQAMRMQQQEAKKWGIGPNRKKPTNGRF